MNTENTLLDVLTCRGLLVSVSVRYWRARKKLDAEDLGLAPEQVDDRLISLGHKRLVPPRARTIQICGLGGGRVRWRRPAWCRQNPVS